MEPALNPPPAPSVPNLEIKISNASPPARNAAHGLGSKLSGISVADASRLKTDPWSSQPTAGTLYESEPVSPSTMPTASAGRPIRPQPSVDTAFGQMSQEGHVTWPHSPSREQPCARPPTPLRNRPTLPANTWPLELLTPLPSTTSAAITRLTHFRGSFEQHFFQHAGSPIQQSIIKLLNSIDESMDDEPVSPPPSPPHLPPWYEADIADLIASPPSAEPSNAAAIRLPGAASAVSFAPGAYNNVYTIFKAGVELPVPTAPRASDSGAQDGPDRGLKPRPRPLDLSRITNLAASTVAVSNDKRSPFTGADHHSPVYPKRTEVDKQSSEHGLVLAAARSKLVAAIRGHRCNPSPAGNNMRRNSMPVAASAKWTMAVKPSQLWCHHYESGFVEHLPENGYFME